jgi:Protein of unknown function (DUF2924)
MDADISDEIAQLRAASREQLLDMWQKFYRRAAPPGIRRELLVPFLAYRMQEHAYGALKASTRSELRRIARGMEKFGPITLTVRPRIKHGSRLLREWRGQTHEVLVTEKGYEYRSEGYRSLSQIARKVTGTRWSGPAFFGLKNTNAVSKRGND